MNAQELFLADKTKAGLWLCEKCRRLAMTQDTAESCCVCACCKLPCGDGARRCVECVLKERAAQDARLFDRAQKITFAEYDGAMLFDGDYHTVDDVEDMPDEERPAYMWACVGEPFVRIDIENQIERWTEDAYEDFDSDHISGLPELTAAVEAFNAANAECLVFTPDHSRVIVFNSPDAKE